MFKNMTLVQRIVLLSFFSVFIIVVVASFSLVNLSTMNNNFNAVINENSKKITLLKDMRSDLLTMRKAEISIISSLNINEMDEFNANFTDAKRELDNKRIRLRELVNEYQKDVLDKFMISYEKYVKVFDDIANLTRSNTNENAKILLRGKTGDIINIVDSISDEISDDLRLDVNNAFKNKNTQSKASEKNQKAVELISNIKYNILKSASEAATAILMLTNKEIEGAANRSDKFIKLALNNAIELKQFTNTNYNIKIDRLIISAQNYDRVRTEILDLTKINSNRKAFNLSKTLGSELSDQALKNMAVIEKDNSEIMRDALVASNKRYNDSFNQSLIVILIALVFIISFVFSIYRFINNRLADIYKKVNTVKSRDFINFEDKVDQYNTDELAQVSAALSNAIKILRDNEIENEKQKWIKNGVAELNKELLGEHNVNEVSLKAINLISTYLNAGVGAMYVYNKDDNLLIQQASYAYIQREEHSNIFKLGEGTVGQVALQKSPIKLKNIKRTQLTIDTGTTSEAPLNTYTFPLIYQNELFGVIELGSTEFFDDKASAFFDLANQIIATALSSAKSRDEVNQLLINTEASNSKLAEQQLQLEASNAELEEQQQQLEETNAQMEEQQQQLEASSAQMEEQQQLLEASNAEMEEQQQQLEAANAQMEEQQQQLESYTLMLEEKNGVLEHTQEELNIKAQDLEMSSQYKSEFLANMSHELRTPLNSIILLSDMLKDNKAKRLDPEEIKKASIIHDSGNELMRLINDVLDLSKIEAGKMELIVDVFDSTQLCEEFSSQFEHVAQQKNLAFITTDDYHATIINDRNRLSQILRNLISNSFKFTKDGSITMHIESTADDKVKISVVDTGIGIPEQQAKSIFEAFKQADGSTSREYGGTGLGLSISKELVKMMGGELTLASNKGKGSIFSIIIPNLQDAFEPSTSSSHRKENKVLIAPGKNDKIDKDVSKTVDDDRDILTAVDETFIIIEDNEKFANILRAKINEQNEYALIALNGQDGLKLALEYNVKGVLLDLGLPDMNGIDLLKEFKTNINLRKIPVYVISGEEKENITKDNGAIGYAHKPVSGSEITSVINKINSFNSKKVKDLLIVEDNEEQRKAITEYIGNGTIKSKGVGSVKDAIIELEKGIYDGVIVDLGLNDGSGYDICEYIKANKLKVPIIIYTGSDLTPKEEKYLRKYTDSIIIKTASSHKRLSDEVDIFMHRVKVNTGVSHENSADIDLSGKKILVVDDDIRNIYVLSEALNSKGATVITANNGKEAIETLDENLDTSIVLMDIMMPVMDGYEATKIIKENARTKNIPVIAVTAKAMQADKDDAIRAGCDDYISKPLKMDILVGIIKGWINKK
jgi:signal transduction histidine kinase/DNA-binding response OmpR family regulator